MNFNNTIRGCSFLPVGDALFLVRMFVDSLENYFEMLECKIISCGCLNVQVAASIILYKHYLSDDVVMQGLYQNSWYQICCALKCNDFHPQSNR